MSQGRLLQTGGEKEYHKFFDPEVFYLWFPLKIRSPRVVGGRLTHPWSEVRDVRVKLLPMDRLLKTPTLKRSRRVWSSFFPSTTSTRTHFLPWGGRSGDTGNVPYLLFGHRKDRVYSLDSSFLPPSLMPRDRFPSLQDGSIPQLPHAVAVPNFPYGDNERLSQESLFPWSLCTGLLVYSVSVTVVLCGCRLVSLVIFRVPVTGGDCPLSSIELEGVRK